MVEAMSHGTETDSELDGDFKWGIQKGVGGKNKDVVFYKSCIYDGVEYFLHDCVYLYAEDEIHPYIGKLVKMWELPNHRKRMKVIWFFRPSEIVAYLWNIPHEKEIFLACGEGKGVSNINPLGVLVGKCNVVCTSKDERNPQPSDKELKMADYIFYRAFDVEKLLITDKLEDEIAETEIRYFLNKKTPGISAAKLEENRNKRKGSPLSHKYSQGEAVHRAAKSSKTSSMGAELKTATAIVNVEKQFSVTNIISRSQNGFAKGVGRSDKDLTTQVEDKPKLKSVKGSYCSGALIGNSSGSPERTSDNESKVRPATDFCAQDKGASKKEIKTEEEIKLYNESGLPWEQEKGLPKKEIKTEEEIKLYNESGPPWEHENGLSKKEAHAEEEIKLYNISGLPLAQEKSIKAEDNILNDTRKQAVDTSKWFKNLTWEDRLQGAYLNEKVVLLQNLDRSYSSEEIENFVYQVFMEKCTAKVIPPVAFSSPHSGQALVIFKSKEVAEAVIEKLKNEHLMLANTRPLLARKAALTAPEKVTKFGGHLTTDQMGFQKQRLEMRNAVSTSHYTQPNTLEYDMAVEWCLLQQWSDLWWEGLREEQGNEIDGLWSQQKQGSPANMSLNGVLS